MKKYLIIFILLILQIEFASSQDFEFYWQIFTSNNYYSVRIVNYKSKSTIMIKETFEDESIMNKLKKNDSDTLVSLLNKYNFPIKGNKTYTITKEYKNTIKLPDTNFLLVNGDTIIKDNMWLDNYEFDNDSNKVYNYFLFCKAGSGGTTYKGYYKTKDEYKKYSVYCSRISILDYKLNMFVYYLISKYFSKTKYTDVHENIKTNKPKKE